MEAYNRRERSSGSEPFEGIESPFLDQELFTGQGEEEWVPRLSAMESESPFIQLNLPAPEQEIIGVDERTVVESTLNIPNRWICAIDILFDRPQVNSRGTGILIGPRYVLTARHIWPDDANGLIISPARNGSNSSNPFGSFRAKAFRFPERYYINLPVQHGRSAGTTTRIPQDDDYMLIILKQDLASKTHPRMRGVLGYWGQNTAQAAVRQLEPEAIQGKEIVVIGYPGDTCGKDRITGSNPEKERAMNRCLHTRKDEWASRQWRSSGIVDARTNVPSKMYHTADTYRGQSGAPVCLTLGETLNLVGIHTEADAPQRNIGLRVTERMLRSLCAWMNADAGYTIASVKDGALIVQPRSSIGSRAREFSDDLEEADSPTEDILIEGFTDAKFGDDENEDEVEWSSAPLDEGVEGFTTIDYEGNEFEALSDQPSEERFEPVSVPRDVADALNKKDWPLALKLAISAGWRNENDLTNLIFFARHTELPAEPLKRDDPNFGSLSAEWAKILNKEVWTAIIVSAENTDLVVSGKEVTDHHRSFFRGTQGQRLRRLVEDAAKEVDLNPGLLGTIMMAETRRPLSYFSSAKVHSYHIGADDFYEGRAAIAARVPAYAKVQWDKKQTPEVHYNDAKKPRLVKTIWFDSGPAGVLATAVYVKFREVRFREIAAELGRDFDSLPLPTRMALVRLAMAAGTAGATPFLKDALNGKDIFIRKAIAVKKYQTQRNATVRTAQAMHLSDWIFGIPVPVAKAQPELETFEDFDPEAGHLHDYHSAMDLEASDSELDSEFLLEDELSYDLVAGEARDSLEEPESPWGEWDSDSAEELEETKGLNQFYEHLSTPHEYGAQLSEEESARDREPARPPFPDSIQDPILWHDDDALKRAFRLAIATVSDASNVAAYNANGVLPHASTIPIVIAWIDTGGKLSFGGQNYVQMYYSGSLLKVAAMYAAFQLRKVVADFAKSLSSNLSQDRVFAEFRKAFNAKILAAAPTIPTSLRVAPKYADILKVTWEGAHSRYRVEFRDTPAHSRQDFKGHLEKMVQDSHNPSAGVCIQSLGYSWINGVLRAAGMFREHKKPGNRLDNFSGVWLAGDYLYTKATIRRLHRSDADAGEELGLGISGLTQVRIPCVNEQAWHTAGKSGDGRSSQATNCLDLTNLFAQIANGALIKADVGANSEIESLLKNAARMSIMTGFAPSTRFDVLQSKIGVGTLGRTGTCIKDPATHRTNGCVLSEAMVIKERGAKKRRFVVVYQDILDPQNHAYKDIERVRDIIEHTIDKF